MSFRNSVKFEASGKFPTDSLLQATDQKRRYMRRGSKSPNMLTKSIQLDRISSEICDSSLSNSPKRRRLSLMSALKLSLEQTAIAPRQVSIPL